MQLHSTLSFESLSFSKGPSRVLEKSTHVKAGCAKGSGKAGEKKKGPQTKPQHLNYALFSQRKNIIGLCLERWQQHINALSTLITHTLLCVGSIDYGNDCLIFWKKMRWNPFKNKLWKLFSPKKMSWSLYQPGLIKCHLRSYISGKNLFKHEGERVGNLAAQQIVLAFCLFTWKRAMQNKCLIAISDRNFRLIFGSAEQRFFEKFQKATAVWQNRTKATVGRV